MQGSKRGERSAVEKPLRGNPKTGFPLRLEIPQTARDSHFPTATAAAVRLHRKCPDNTPESYIPKWLDTPIMSKDNGALALSTLFPCLHKSSAMKMALTRTEN